jgi:hypothetical protein
LKGSVVKPTKCDKSIVLSTAEQSNKRRGVGGI